MADFKIETGVELPPKRSAASAYPFADMKVGDSFLAKGVKPATLSGAARRFAAKEGGKFTVRKTDKGPRCWREE